MNAKYDPSIDKLIDTSPPAKVAAPCGPPKPFVHPNPDIARAAAAYQEALKAAQPPETTRPSTPEPPKPDPFKRPGFA